MQRKSFTLIEILVALIVLSILASFSVAVYQKTIDANNERICQQNLKVLQAAIDIYTVENDILPAALSQLTPRQIYLASSRVIGKRKESFLSIAFRKMFSTEAALADTEGEKFKHNYLKDNIKVFCDPADTGCNPSNITSCTASGCGSSYNINLNTADPAIFDLTKKRLNLTSNAALIQDSSPTRHGHGSSAHALGITPGGRVGKITGGNIYPPAGN